MVASTAHGCPCLITLPAAASHPKSCSRALQCRPQPAAHIASPTGRQHTTGSTSVGCDLSSLRPGGGAQAASERVDSKKSCTGRATTEQSAS